MFDFIFTAAKNLFEKMKQAVGYFQSALEKLLNTFSYIPTSVKMLGDLGVTGLNIAGQLGGIPLIVYGLTNLMLLVKNNVMVQILVSMPMKLLGSALSNFAYTYIGPGAWTFFFSSAFLTPALALGATYIVANSAYQLVKEQGIFGFGREHGPVRYGENENVMRTAMAFLLPLGVFFYSCMVGGTAPVALAVAVSFVCNAVPYGLNDAMVDGLEFTRTWRSELDWLKTKIGDIRNWFKKPAPARDSAPSASPTSAPVVQPTVTTVLPPQHFPPVPGGNNAPVSLANPPADESDFETITPNLPRLVRQ